MVSCGVAKNPIVIIPNGIRSKFGYSNEVVYKGDLRNTLVNFKRVTAKERERGISYITRYYLLNLVQFDLLLYGV